uniref:CAF1B/HIR1 beta-propeller domain-containing protein n=2 Tax=Trichobilharzia regenti TaxID=157069 RepID=A0AA85JEJ9_TRIRE|nr:unnamed protein product [Trichobilharzia regenti]
MANSKATSQYSSMRFITPEIAWHETLPIYSCDLQNRGNILDNNHNNINSGCNDSKSSRIPLAEINLKSVKDFDPDSNWTRLATAGADNFVRLWRVQLNWLGTTATRTKQTESQCNVGMVTTTLQKSENEKLKQLVHLASLKRHEKPVNVVRWSPSGDYLASAGDDLFIIIWLNQTVNNGVASLVDSSTSVKDEDDYDALNAEVWIPCRSLRRHLEDIYDICWSPDERALISGSVDHSIIVWQLDLAPSSSSATAVEDVGNVGDTALDNVNPTRPENTTVSSATNIHSGIKALILRDHKHYVQGVTWDPLGFYVASLSSDRACRIYRAGTKNCLAHVSKAGKQRLFQDDSWKSFFRRLTFSPDGLFLVCPSGNLEEAQFAEMQTSNIPLTNNGAQHSDNVLAAIPPVAPQHAAHIFVRSNFTRPVVSLPTGSKPVVAVRFCPQPFQLRQTNFLNQNTTNQCTKLFNLDYRWLFCLVLEDSVLFYDTQQSVPFAQVSQLHYQALNDATWSKDGHLVVVCSTDGYCSLIHFAHGELGAHYRGVFGASSPQPSPMGTAIVGEMDKYHSNTVEMELVKPDCTLNETPSTENDSSKVDSPSVDMCDLNKSTNDQKITDMRSDKSTTNVDNPVLPPKPQKRRVQLTTLLSFVETDNSSNKTKVSTLQRSESNSYSLMSVESTSQECQENKVI